MFPDKRIVMGVYMRDYPSRSPVPVDLLRFEMGTGSITGYSILGGCLIDQHPAQAEFLRDFIADS